jgi:hypothetical protein
MACLQFLPMDLVHKVCLELGPFQTLVMARLCKRWYRCLSDDPGRPLWACFERMIPDSLNICSDPVCSYKIDSTVGDPSCRAYTSSRFHTFTPPAHLGRIKEPRRRVLYYLSWVVCRSVAAYKDTPQTCMGRFVLSYDFYRAVLANTDGRMPIAVLPTAPVDHCRATDYRYVRQGTHESPLQNQPHKVCRIVQLRVTVFYLAMLRAVVANAYERTADGFRYKSAPDLPKNRTVMIWERTDNPEGIFTIIEDPALGAVRSDWPDYFYNESINGPDSFSEMYRVQALDIPTGAQPLDRHAVRVLPSETCTAALLSVADWRAWFSPVVPDDALCLARHMYPLTDRDLSRGWVNLDALPPEERPGLEGEFAMDLITYYTTHGFVSP